MRACASWRQPFPVYLGGKLSTACCCIMYRRWLLHAASQHPWLCCPLQRRLSEIERLEARATAILDEVAQRTGVGEAAESLWAK